MTKITASDVNNLRKSTGAGMMDCKNALVEAEGNFDKAVEILRKKGQKVAAKRADRNSSEGVALAITNNSNEVGIGIVLACETDFVAKNDDFVKLAFDIADIEYFTVKKVWGAGNLQPFDVSKLKNYDKIVGIFKNLENIFCFFIPFFLFFNNK